MLDFNRAIGQIRALGGEVYGVVAQGQEAADTAKRNWRIEFPMVSDPQVRIGEILAERGLLDIYVDGANDPTSMAAYLNKDFGIGGRGQSPTGPATAGGRYEVGMYQPAILALGRDYTPLFSWASRPSAQNIGGAANRPTAKQTLKAIRASLGGDTSLVNWDPASKKAPLPLPVFYFLLLANGNFLKPRGFGLDAKGGGGVNLRPAVARAGAAVGALAASVALRRPDPRVTLAAFGAWVAYIHLAWGNMFQAVWKPFGSDPENSLLRRRRRAKL